MKKQLSTVDVAKRQPKGLVDGLSKHAGNLGIFLNW